MEKRRTQGIERKKCGNEGSHRYGEKEMTDGKGNRAK